LKNKPPRAKMLKVNVFVGLLWLTIAVHSAAIKDDEEPMEAATGK
jgi:hypothetical protein